VAYKIVCEKRLYEGTEVCRYVGEPRADLFKPVLDPLEPPLFREIERLPVRLFQVKKELAYFRVRLRFLVYTLRRAFEVKSVTRLSPIALTVTECEHLVELHAFVLIQEQANEAAAELEYCIGEAVWRTCQYEDGVIWRERKIRQGGGSAKDRRKRRRRILRRPVWWDAVPEVEVSP